MKKILIIGSGFYSLGYEEILGICYSSILQWSKENNYNNILITFLVRKKSRKKLEYILSRKRKNELFFNHKLKVKIDIKENISFKDYSCAFLILTVYGIISSGSLYSCISALCVFTYILLSTT